VSTAWTLALAGLLAGSGVRATQEAEQESARVFAELAAVRATPLEELARRCLGWRDASDELAREVADRLGLSSQALLGTLAATERCFDSMLLRLCAAFEGEPRQT
jgi:hypothetical protein